MPRPTEPDDGHGCSHPGVHIVVLVAYSSQATSAITNNHRQKGPVAALARLQQSMGRYPPRAN